MSGRVTRTILAVVFIDGRERFTQARVWPATTALTVSRWGAKVVVRPTGKVNGMGMEVWR